MGFKDYLFAGVDSLNATIDQALSEDKREMSKVDSVWTIGNTNNLRQRSLPPWVPSR